MGLLCNTYIFYADIYLIQNVIIKITVLGLIRFCIEGKEGKAQARKKGKILVLAMGGTLFEIVLLMQIPIYTLVLLAVYAIEIPVLTFLLLGKHKFWKGLGLGYLFTLLINGLLEALGNLLGTTGFFMGLLCLACSMVGIGVIYYLRQRKINKGIYEISLFQGESHISLGGMFDSGNQLKDPYTGKGVHIISKEGFECLKIITENKVYIPFQSLGNMEDMLEVYYIERMQVIRDGREFSYERVPVGIAMQDIFHGKGYEMILNEEIFDV